MIDLPKSSCLNIGALASLFDRVTNSYKLLFFQALLKKIKDDSSLLEIDLQEVGVEMLALAWYPHVFFRLSFGVQDKIGISLDQLRFDADQRSIGNIDVSKSLRRAISVQWEDIGGQKLLRYVSYRLLRRAYTFFRS